MFTISFLSYVHHIIPHVHHIIPYVHHIMVMVCVQRAYINGVSRTILSVAAARFKQWHTSSTSARWQSSLEAYGPSTLLTTKQLTGCVRPAYAKEDHIIPHVHHIIPHVHRIIPHVHHIIPHVHHIIPHVHHIIPMFTACLNVPFCVYRKRNLHLIYCPPYGINILNRSKLDSLFDLNKINSMINNYFTKRAWLV